MHLGCTHTHTHKQCSNTVVQAKVKASTNVVKTIGRKIFTFYGKKVKDTQRLSVVLFALCEMQWHLFNSCLHSLHSLD